jgi:hypothetical protein
MWFDTFDRAPALDVTAAIDACRKLGGHLPSERDLIEAIRAGLPNGSNTFLQTSDPEIGQVPMVSGILLGVVKWTGTMPTYDDVWTTTADSRATWGWPTDVRPYRCMWTNELR